MNHSIQSMLDPQTIAIVGASPKPGSFGGAVLANLARHFKGQVFPVNPQYQEISGYPCYPSLDMLPQRPDCVGIAVASDKVEAVLLQAADCGISSAIVFSSGFSETDSLEGGQRQARLTQIARSRGIRVLGPNCTGVINVRSGASCNILPSVKFLPMVPGHVGLVGQSGALGYVVFQAMHRGVGFSHLISTGNSCDVDIADLIDYLVDDPDTKVIASIFESVPDGARLHASLQRAFDAGKPVVVYKIGVTASGQKAALSHSGMLAGDAATYRALFNRTGTVQVESFEALLETAVFFSRAGTPDPLMDSRKIGVISGSGGSVVMAADKADIHGLVLPALAKTTTEALNARLPSFATIANPADLTAESIRDESMYEECVRIFADDPGFAAVVILMPSAHGESAVRRAQGISELAGLVKKPLSLVWMNEWYEGIGSRVYDESQTLAMFRSLDRCMSAHRLWFEYGQRKAQSAALQRQPVSLVSQASRDAARAYICTFAPGANLTEAQAKRLFQFYGIECTHDVLCTSADQAVKAARQIGYPVVAKIQAAGVGHKSDMGGVKLSLKSDEDVRQAYEEIMIAAQGLGFSAGLEGIEGVSIQKMISPGVEMIIGTRRDPQFGPIVVYGFGGTLVEVFKDVAVSLAPVDPVQASASLSQLRLSRLLEGVRGAPASDVGFYVEQVARLSALASDLVDEIAEIDINPMVLHGKGGVAVDGLVIRSDSA